jgi:hypothetical protein
LPDAVIGDLVKLSNINLNVLLINAMQHTLSTSVLYELAQSNSVLVRQALADSERSLPEEVLRILADDVDDMVVQSVARRLGM